MKAIYAFSLLFAVLIFACYVDVTVPEKSSASTSLPSSDSSSHSSSSLAIATQEPLVYQGQSYKTVKIGSQIWLAKNLNAIPNSEKNYWCHGELEERCGTYGKLYDWKAANDVCPGSLGWKLPSKGDYETLSEYVDLLKLDHVDVLLATSVWDAIFGGFKYEDERGFSSPLNEEGFWWSSTEAGDGAYYYNIKRSINELVKYEGKKTRGYSVRCIKK